MILIKRKGKHVHKNFLPFEKGLRVFQERIIVREHARCCLCLFYLCEFILTSQNDLWFFFFFSFLLRTNARASCLTWSHTRSLTSSSLPSFCSTWSAWWLSHLSSLQPWVPSLTVSTWYLWASSQLSVSSRSSLWGNTTSPMAGIYLIVWSWSFPLLVSKISRQRGFHQK